MNYEPVMGIEVHAQLKTNTKLFCGCSTAFGGGVNAHVCPVCLGLPGALPVLNRQAVIFALQAGMALNCEIQHKSVFARKNYFYPDLPKGYQISQFELPILLNGHLDIEVEGKTKRIGITRIHMEEDAGKLLHQGADAIAGATHSLVDLNRACTPLIEIVSEPDIRSAAEARAYVESLRLVLQHIGVCDGNMDQGSLRADINLSLRPKGTETFGTRTEVKNVNSFRSIERAIASEIKRQAKVLDSGGEVIQQTRNYDDSTQTTTALRSKEEAHDYRYFPDPDLLPLYLTDEMIDEAKSGLGELPKAKVARYQSDYGLSDFDCKVLVQDMDMDRYFQACVAASSKGDAKQICKWVTGDLNAALKEREGSFADTKASPEKLVAMVALINDGTLSGKMAKDILVKLIDTGKDPKALVEASGVAQISDDSALQGFVDQVLAENPDVVEKIRGGKTQSANFLMGQVMKLSKGQAKPDIVMKLILSSIQ